MVCGVCVGCVCVWCVLGACGMCLGVCGVCGAKLGVHAYQVLALSLWTRVQSFFSVRAIIKHTQFHVVASLVQMADLKLEHHRADISVNLIRFQVYRQLFNIFDCSPRNA